MKDKKFKLLLVSALGFGQAFCIGTDELDDQLGDILGSSKKSVVSGFSDSASSSNSSNGKKLVETYVPGSEKKIGNNKKDLEISYDFMLNLPGKDPFKISIKSNYSLGKGTDIVEAYLENVSNYDKLTENLRTDIQNYNNKIQAIEKNKELYTPMFITHINTKYNSFLESEKDILTKSSDVINKEKKAIQDHVDNISKATGILTSDYEIILSNLKSINNKLEPLYKHYQKLEAAVSEVSEALDIFNQEAAANKKKAEEIKAKKAAKEAAIKAEQEQQKATALAKQKKDQEAIAAAQAAAEKAEQERRQAEALAKQKEEAAAKAEAELNIKNAELEAMKIDTLIARMNDLRNRADGVALNLSTLVSDIEKNADKYQDEFVNTVRARIESRIADLQKEFNARIQNINSMITKMQELDNERNQIKTKLQSERGWFSWFNSNSSQLTDLLDKYASQYKTVSSLFDTSERIYNNLLTVYNEIQKTALNARVVDPKAVAATLDLARAVRIRQVAMAPRVLELAYAVRHK